MEKTMVIWECLEEFTEKLEEDCLGIRMFS